jgi:hypothetical protein
MVKRSWLALVWRGLCGVESGGGLFGVVAREFDADESVAFEKCCGASAAGTAERVEDNAVVGNNFSEFPQQRDRLFSDVDAFAVVRS